MRRNLFIVGMLVLVALLVWFVSRVPARSPAAPVLAATPVPPTSCAACAQATAAAAQTQEAINLSAQQAQASATADILRAHARATSNAQAATQGAVLTQARGSANVLQAQVAATAQMLQANTLATSNAADATQSAADTEVVLQQLTSSAATQNANATAMAVGAFQTQSAVVQKAEPSASPWTWVPPLLITAAAVLTLWGVSRWLARRQNGGRSETSVSVSRPSPDLLGIPPPLAVNLLPLPVIKYPLPPRDAGAQLEDEVVPSRDQTAEPDGRQLPGWLDDVKDKL